MATHSADVASHIAPDSVPFFSSTSENQHIDTEEAHAVENRAKSTKKQNRNERTARGISSAKTFLPSDDAVDKVVAEVFDVCSKFAQNCP